MKRKERIEIELPDGKEPFAVMDKLKVRPGVLKISVINFSALCVYYNPQQIAEQR